MFVMKQISINSIREKVYNTIRDDDDNDLLSNIFDTIIVLLILINTFIIILDTYINIRPYIDKFRTPIEIISIIIFTIEYFLRIWTSVYIFPKLKPIKAVIKYIFSVKSIIDLIALIPFYFSLFLLDNFNILRLIRLFRILSILKTNRYSKAISTIGQIIKRKSIQLFSSCIVVFILILFSSVFMYYIENESQPEIFDNAFSGIWWAISTLTTVGYGDIYPVTILGKVVGTFIAILGIGLIAIPTGLISAGFVEEMYNNKSKGKKYCPHCGKKLLYMGKRHLTKR